MADSKESVMVSDHFSVIVKVVQEERDVQMEQSGKFRRDGV